MLEMRDVCFHYGNGTPILENMNVEIGAGEFIGLGGRNGCGKTTVTRLLMGLEKPVSGEIRYDGRIINEDDASRRSAFIGYVFQRPERQMFRPTYGMKSPMGHSSLAVRLMKLKPLCKRRWNRRACRTWPMPIRPI